MKATPDKWDVIESLATKHLGVTVGQFRKWRSRDQIASRYHIPLLAVADQVGADLSIDDLKPFSVSATAGQPSPQSN